MYLKTHIWWSPAHFEDLHHLWREGSNSRGEASLHPEFGCEPELTHRFGFVSDVGQLKDGDDKDVDDNHDEDKGGDDNDDEDKDGDDNDDTLHLASALRLLLLTYISNHTQEREHVHSAYIRILPGASLRS